MKLAANQPYFFPYIGYYQLINAVDRFVLYSDIDYIKKGWINRNRIASKSACITDYKYLTVPVRLKMGMKIKDVFISSDCTWASKICKLILATYRGCRFFDEIFPSINSILTGRDYSYISDLNETVTRNICALLDIKTEIVSDIGRYGDLEKSLSNLQNDGYLNFQSYEKLQLDRKIIRPLEICRIEGADQYINAIGGKLLYDRQTFEEYGTEIRFLKTANIEYDFIGSSFVPNLSIIDVLMMNGIKETKELLNHFSLE